MNNNNNNTNTNNNNFFLGGWSTEVDEAMRELFGLEEGRFYSGCREPSSRTP